MKGMKRFIGLAVAAGLGLTACEPIDDDGGGGTAGGVFNSGFAFVRSDRNLYVVDDQGDPNSPTALTTDGRAQQPAVSRNGRSIVFVRKPATGGAEIQTVPTVAGSQASAVFSTTDVACSNCTGFRSPVFDPSGNFIVFVIERGAGANTSLGRVNVNGSGFQELTPNPGISYGAPSFYPDGGAVLVPAGSSLTQLNQLARVPVDGSSPPLFFNSTLGNEARVVVTRAVVSSDGTRVAFDGEVSTGGSRIFVASLGSSGIGTPTALTAHAGEAGARDTYPSWVGTTQLGFLSNAGGSDNIYRISAATTTPGTGSLVVPSALEPAYGPN
jgi:TolB protein